MSGTTAIPVTILSDVEKGFLITYNVINTLLIILFNGTVIITIAFTKVKLRTNPSLIPVLVASLLGLLHGLGPTLTSTLALILDKQIGPRLWCEIANVLHRHIVFSIIYCATLISVEAAYMIANPLSYNRSGFKARLVISFSTILTLLLLLPVHVLYFYWLQPEKLKIILVEEWGWPEDYAEKVWNEYFGKSTFTLVRRYQTCERFFIPRSLDYRIKRYFTMTVSLAAVGLVLASYGVIFATILKSRQTFGNKQRETADKLKTRAQNAKIVKAAIIMTGLTLLPWLPNITLTVLFEAKLQAPLEDLIGREELFGIVDATNYLFYTVPWVFPLLNLLTNPVISKSLASFRERKKEGTVNRTLNTAVTSRSTLSNTRVSNKAAVHMAVFAGKVSSQKIETRHEPAHRVGINGGGGGGDGGGGGGGGRNGMTPVVVITNDHAL